MKTKYLYLPLMYWTNQNQENWVDHVSIKNVKKIASAHYVQIFKNR